MEKRFSVGQKPDPTNCYQGKIKVGDR